MAFFQEWKTQYRTYNRNIRLSIFVNLFTQIGLGIFMVIYNFYIRELGFTDGVNGKIISMTALASAMILIPAGLISDRYGRKKAMLYGVILSGCVLIFRSVVEAEGVLIFFAFLTGLTTAFLQVSLVPWLAENSRPNQRVHLFSIHFAVMTAANVIGHLLGGTLTDLFSLFFSELSSIRFTLMIGGGIFLIGLFPLIGLKEDKKKKTKEENQQGRKFFTFHKESIKLIFLFAVAQLIIGIGSGLVIPYLNLYFADRFSSSNSLIGIIISLGQLATAVAMVIGPIMVRKFGEVRAVVLLQLLSLPFLLLTAFTDHLWVAVLGFLFRQALMNAGNPIQTSLIMNKVQDSMKGFANSMNQMVFNIGWALMGPISTGIVLTYGSYWGYAYVFSITAGLYLIAATYFYLVFKRVKPSAIIVNAKAV